MNKVLAGGSFDSCVTVSFHSRVFSTNSSHMMLLDWWETGVAAGGPAVSSIVICQVPTRRLPRLATWKFADRFTFAEVLLQMQNHKFFMTFVANANPQPKSHFHNCGICGLWK